MQLDVHNEPVLVLIQPWYNAHPNGKGSTLTIVFHPMKSQSHHREHGTKLVVMFLQMIK